jgi:hypothetical protein
MSMDPCSKSACGKTDEVVLKIYITRRRKGAKK